jgi:hypothetical protein
MLVEVRPLEIQRWHKKKGKEAFSQPKTIEVLYSEELGYLATGLTDEEAKEYGEKMGVDLSNKFNPEEPHPFWSSKASWISLPNKTEIFNTSRASDYVRVANLKASKFVANSIKEHEQGLWPDATHVIFSEEDEMEAKATKFQIKQKIGQLLLDASLERKIALVQILSNKTVKGRSANFVDGMISELVEEKTDELLKALGMNKEEVIVRSSVLELLQKNILTKQGSAVYYMGDKIGLDYEDTVKYFKDPNNAVMKVTLLEKLQ